ncbi:Uma2 family endonuclease [candidate division KSB1 bacterium]|nr:Uma2 family endonuclease [candidate division KSB1 bacterium]
MSTLATKIPDSAKFTYEDYLLIPDDGKQYEILEGELQMSPSPTFVHQQVSANLFTILNNYVRTHKLGKVLYAPLDIVLSPYNVVQPDLLFVSNKNLTKIN